MCYIQTSPLTLCLRENIFFISPNGETELSRNLRVLCSIRIQNRSLHSENCIVRDFTNGYSTILAALDNSCFLVSLIGNREFPQIQTRYLTITDTNM